MLNKIMIVVQLIPAVIEIVKTVESMFPIPGAGKEKLKLVREMLTAAHGGLEDIWPSIERIVSAIVNFANAVGVFKRGE
jgi:hypothetical protein